MYTLHFITALNLLPVGQLDGGHILYTLIRRKAHPVAMAVLWSLLKEDWGDHWVSTAPRVH